MNNQQEWNEAWAQIDNLIDELARYKQREHGKAVKAKPPQAVRIVFESMPIELKESCVVALPCDCKNGWNTAIRQVGKRTEVYPVRCEKCHEP